MKVEGLKVGIKKSQRTKSGTLQGTQSQHTKANLAKSLPCANAQPTHPG
jgi:hypothetical protein